LAKLQVEVNEEKSRKVDLQQGESFGFLAFEFRRIRSQLRDLSGMVVCNEFRADLYYRAQRVSRFIGSIAPASPGYSSIGQTFCGCLRTPDGTRGAAAKIGLKRTTLPFKMKKLGIRRPMHEGGFLHDSREEIEGELGQSH